MFVILDGIKEMLLHPISRTSIIESMKTIVPWSTCCLTIVVGLADVCGGKGLTVNGPSQGLGGSLGRADGACGLISQIVVSPWLWV